VTSDTYKGESPGKKLARLTFWWCCHTYLGDEFSRGRFLVLASREGGDVAVLRGMGVGDDQIVAVDRSESALAAFRQKFPSVQAFHGDVAEAAAQHRRVTVACLDFCGEISNAALALSMRVKRRCRPAILGLCFQRGRESPRDETRRRALQMSRDYRAMRKSDPESAGPSDLSRMVSALAYLVAQSSGEAPLVPLVINYHSRTRDGAGVPMTMFPVQWAPWDVAEQMVARGWPHVAEFTYLSEFDLRRRAVDLAIRVNAARAHELLNVSRETFVAWKAHATRGTYSKSA